VKRGGNVLTNGTVPWQQPLVNREIKGIERKRLLKASEGYVKIPLNAWSYSDLQMLGTGVFSPLEGFVGSEDWESILDNMRLANGAIWSIPITLAVPTGYDLICG
jgi:sulfate adenylyltransferase